MRARLALAILTFLSLQPLRSQSPAPSPAFDVVSIRPTTTLMGRGGFPIELPNGGIRFTGTTVVYLLQRAYPTIVIGEIVGLPEWARREGYDVNATSPLTTRASEGDQVAMIRAMLRDRFGLVAHIERRSQPSLALVPARKDGALGPGLTKIDKDCTTQQAEQREAAAIALAAGRPPPGFDRNQPPVCSWRQMGSLTRESRLEGEGTLASFAWMLRLETRGQVVVDQTGFPGTYRAALTYTSEVFAPRDAPPGTGPDFTTALREQFGLKLESARIERDTLVVERLERPSEN
jgi:uncharacterized protein (TIGR03435 family)